MLNSDDPANRKKRNRYNIIIAVLAGQVGCLTLLIVIAALLGGMALDAHLGTKPWLTLGLIIISIPVSIILMVIIAKKTVSKIKTSKSDAAAEEDSIGKNS